MRDHVFQAQFDMISPDGWNNFVPLKVKGKQFSEELLSSVTRPREQSRPLGHCTWYLLVLIQGWSRYKEQYKRAAPNC